MERLYGETTTQKNFKDSKRDIDYLAQRRLFANIAHRGLLQRGTDSCSLSCLKAKHEEMSLNGSDKDSVTQKITC